MLGGKEVQLYLLFMLRKLHGKNPLNAYQVRNKVGCVFPMVVSSQL